jgi:hypothetical protein
MTYPGFLAGLFVSQCDYRINAGSSSRRNPAYDQGDGQEYRGYHGKRSRIGRFDLEQKRVHDAGQGKSACEAKRETRQRQSKSLGQDETQHRARFSTERQPNSDFVRPLPDCIRHYPIRLHWERPCLC